MLTWTLKKIARAVEILIRDMMIDGQGTRIRVVIDITRRMKTIAGEGIRLCVFAGRFEKQTLIIS